MSSSKGCLGWNHHVWSLGSNRCSMCGKTKDSVRAEYPRTYGCCPLCGHYAHNGIFCKGISECDCGNLDACVCSYPDPSNFAEAPE